MALALIRNALGFDPKRAPVFFPDCPGVARDVALLILHKVSDQDLAHMCHINRTWNHFIRTLPSLNNRLISSSCLCMAKAIKFVDDGHITFLFRQTEVLFKLAMVDPSHDLTAVKRSAKTSSGINLSPPMLWKLVRWEARHDLEAATTTALEHCYVPDLLIEIVKVIAQHDLMRAKSIAQIIEDRFQNPALLARALAVIAKASDQNFTAAYAAAEESENSLEKTRALLEIAELDPQADLSIIKALIPTISPWGHFYDVKSSAFADIVKLEARRDLAGAKITAEHIDSEYYQPQAFSDIVLVEAMIDPDAAEATAERITNASDRSRAFLAIVKVKALYDIEAAIAIAKKMDNGEAFIEIVKVQVQHSRSDALATIEMIKDSYCKTLALLEIAKWNSKHDLTAVKAEAEKIVYGFDLDDDLPDYTPDHDKALLKIIDIEAQHDLYAAKATALKIEDDYYLFKAFLKIAKAAQSRLTLNR